MDQYLAKLGYDFLATAVALPAALETLITADFLLENDCVVLTRPHDPARVPLLESDLAKCEWEDGQTHFHPSACTTELDDELTYLTLALESGKRLMSRFTAELPQHRFRLTISFSETFRQNDEIEFFGSSTVRFYQIRSGGESTMRVDDLNRFKTEAVLEMETPTPGYLVSNTA